MSRAFKYWLCRLCLSGHGEIVNIFGDTIKLDFVVEDAIEDLIKLKVVRDTEYPWLVCSKCLDKLDDFRSFKQRCLENQFVYQNRIDNDVSPKDDDSTPVQDEGQINKGSVDTCPSPGETSVQVKVECIEDETGEGVAQQEQSPEKQDRYVDPIKVECQVTECSDIDLEAFMDTIGSAPSKRKRKAKDHKYPSEADSPCDTSGDEGGHISNPPARQPPQPLSIIKVLKVHSGQLKNFDAVGHKVPLKAIRLGLRKDKAIQQLPTNAVPNTSLVQMAPTTLQGGVVPLVKSQCGQPPGQREDDKDKMTDPAVKDILLSIQRRMNNQFSVMFSQLSSLSNMISKGDTQTRDSINALTEKLESIPQIASCVVSDEFKSLEELHSFPTRTVPELLEVEGELAGSKKYQDFLVKYLRDRSSNMLYKSVTSDTFSAALNKTVNDICSTLMSKEMSTKFCVKGRAVNKINFEKDFSNIITIILLTVQTKGPAGQQVDLIRVKKSIGDWFRVSKQRIVGRRIIQLNPAQNMEDEDIDEISL